MNADPRKVCHLSSAHPWFDQRIFHKEAKSLAKAGYDVAYIAPHDRSETVDGVRILGLPKPQNRVQRMLTGTLRVLRRALKENAHVYHFHDPELIWVGVVLKLMGKKVIYDAHEDYQEVVLSRSWVNPRLAKPLSWIWWQLEKTASRLFDAVLARDSDLVKKFPPHKSYVITNAPPLRFLDTTGRKEQSDKFRVVHLGAIEKERGIFETIEALDYLRHDSIELHVMGAADDAELERVLQTNPRIVHHGRIPWDQLRSVLEQSDVGLLLLQPTRAHLTLTGEGNTKLFEYMAVGLPVLFSDFPKLKQFIGSLGAGMPVDSTDPRKIAEAIDFLYEHPDARREMGQRGREAVRDRYHWEYEEKTLLDVYRRIVAGPHAASCATPGANP